MIIIMDNLVDSTLNGTGKEGREMNEVEEKLMGVIVEEFEDDARRLSFIANQIDGVDVVKAKNLVLIALAYFVVKEKIIIKRKVGGNDKNS